MKKRRYIESDEQIALFDTLDTYYPVIAALTHCVPNGGYRTKVEAIRLRAEGVRPGIPDIYCDFAAKGYHGLRIEFKPTIKPGQPKRYPTQEQKQKIIQLNENGYYAKVCYGFDDALGTILEYWNLGPW